ncbi:hypothetical protein V2J09_019994 [Rumex salicifolius]
MHSSSGSIDSLTLDFDQEQELSIKDRIKIFKSSQFDSDGYFTSKCPNMTEKEIKHLCVNLKELKKASAEEMRKSVYANYAAFIRTAKEISALEGQLVSLKNLLSAQATIVHGLADGACLDSVFSAQEGLIDVESSNNQTITELAKVETWLAEFIETMDVLLAEKRVEAALDTIQEGEAVAENACDRKIIGPKNMLSLKNAIAEQRQKLLDQLVETAGQPSTSCAELRSVVAALKRLGDGPHAHTLLLNAHHHRLKRHVRNLCALGATSRGAYCASLAQLVFSTIAQVASDCLNVFGDEETCFVSELVNWTIKETENLALLAKRYSLASSAGTGNLRAAIECVHACLGHCSLLEARGLTLAPVLTRHFKPCVDQALTSNLKRIEMSCAALAADDDWCLTLSQPKLSRSAHRFNSMIQEIFEDAETLEILQLSNSTLEGAVQVFSSYVNTLINALPASLHEVNPEGRTIVKQAETESQQLALLANALFLADDLIPRAASRILHRHCRAPEVREWKKKLQRLVDNLRDTFCRQHTLELIFADDGSVLLNPHMYTDMDNQSHEPEWFPSGVFQELFARLTEIASLAADIFVGKERFATVLLMRLIETVILWLSDDQTFWVEIEQGEKRLGPFVILFASQGRYLSRNLQQAAKNVIARAIDAVSASGIDPYNHLPEDEWFADVAQIAIKMLTGKATFDEVESDAISPAASTSHE